MLFPIIAGVSIISLLIGLDIWFAVDKIPGNTWSEMIRSMAFFTTFIPWVCGILSGHFFHPGWQQAFERPTNFAVLIWLSMATSIVGFAILRSNFQYNNWVPMITFLIAVFVGAKLWPV